MWEVGCLWLGLLFSSVCGNYVEFGCTDYTDPHLYGEDGLPTFRPLIIAHRGASGMYPEHTALAYRKAAEQGADYIECDLAITKDYKFICAHEPWLSGTTDVSDKVEFENRKTTYNMDDDDDLIHWNDKGNITDWFSFDFTLEELRTLKKYQSQNFRDPRYDLQETVVTLDELVDITREIGLEQGRTIGIYPEMKHCHAVNKILQNRNSSVRFEEIVLQTLKDLGFKSNSDPVFLQSFEFTSLEYIRNKTELKLVLLLERMIEEKDWERIDNLQLAGLGIDKGVLVTPGVPDEEGRGQYRYNTTQFIAKVHEHGLKAHAFTFRNEWMKLYWDHGQDPYSQMKEFLDLGLDGYFTDFPLTVRRFLKYENLLCSGSITISRINGFVSIIAILAFFVNKSVVGSI